VEWLYDPEPSLPYIGGLTAGCDAKSAENRCATFRDSVLHKIKCAVLGNCWFHAHFLIELFNLETPIGFGSWTGFSLCARLRDLNRLARDATQIAGEAELRQDPNQPFRWIPLPRFHSVTVIVLKFVMIVVIALAERKQCHEERVACAASCRIRLAPDSMTGRVNQERAVLEHDNFCNATNEETAERADRACGCGPAECHQAAAAMAAHLVVDLLEVKLKYTSIFPALLSLIFFASSNSC